MGNRKGGGGGEGRAHGRNLTACNNNPWIPRSCWRSPACPWDRTEGAALPRSLEALQSPAHIQGSWAGTRRPGSAIPSPPLSSPLRWLRGRPWEAWVPGPGSQEPAQRGSRWAACPGSRRTVTQRRSFCSKALALQRFGGVGLD